MIVDQSQGIDPVPAIYDPMYSQWVFRVDNREFVYDCRRMPFSLIDTDKGMAADKELVLAHAGRQAKRYYG